MDEKNKEKKDIRFIRLRYSTDDLVALVVKETKTSITVRNPLLIMVETVFEESRQILSFQEYLPQSIIEAKEAKFLKSDIILIEPTRDEFIEQYENISNFFYNNRTSLKTATKKDADKDIQENAQKVVSLLEAMANKKDKPVH